MRRKRTTIPGIRALRAASKNLGEWGVSEELRAAHRMLLCIGNTLGDENSHRFINFIEAAYIAPMNEAQST